MSLRTWRRKSTSRAGSAPHPGSGWALRPLDGTASIVVAADMSMTAESIGAASVPLTWSLRTATGWHRVQELAPRPHRQGIGALSVSAAVDEGEVHFVVDAGVAGGAPIGVIEVTNASSGPIAVGIDADTHADRRVENGTYWAGEQPLVTSWLSPRPAPATQATVHEPELIVPLPHATTARFSVPLGAHAPWIVSGSRGAVAVPTVTDIERGWHAHLSRGMLIKVADDERWGDSIGPLMRSILTAPPDETEATDITAAALYGFALSTDQALAAVERQDATPSDILIALGTWNRLDQAATQTSDEALERFIVAAAKAAHTIARSKQAPTRPIGAGRRPIEQLARALNGVGQPDVAERVEALGSIFDPPVMAAPPASLETLEGWLQSLVGQTSASLPPPNPTQQDRLLRARYLVALRELFVDAGSADSIVAFGAYPPAWRGRAIDVFKAPIDKANLSYGIRWHGPRPALLWSLDGPIEGTAPVLSVPAIDPTWSTNEPAGEALLADPGWTRR